MVLMLGTTSCTQRFVVPSEIATSAASPLAIPSGTTMVVIPPGTRPVFLASTVPSTFYLSSRGAAVIINGIVVMR